MTRLRVLALFAALPAYGAFLPEQIMEFTRGKVTELRAPDQELYKEYGFQSAEEAEYSGPGGSFKLAGWRVHDSTGAMSLFQLRRPADATEAPLTELAVKTTNGIIAVYGNFVFEYTNRSPKPVEWDELLVQLKGVERSALPTLRNHLPEQGLVPNSERYILGPVSLARFAGQIPPSVAAFHLAAEGQLGRYKTGNGEFDLIVFEYPTPNMARERQELFLKEPNTIAKRAGPLVAVISGGQDSGAGGTALADDQERVLAQVLYEPQLTRHEVGEGAVKGLANIVLTGSLLAVVLIGASLLAGIWLGGFRALLRKLGWAKEEEAITVLRIRD